MARHRGCGPRRPDAACRSAPAARRGCVDGLRRPGDPPGLRDWRVPRPGDVDPACRSRGPGGPAAAWLDGCWSRFQSSCARIPPCVRKAGSGNVGGPFSRHCDRSGWAKSVCPGCCARRARSLGGDGMPMIRRRGGDVAGRRPSCDGRLMIRADQASRCVARASSLGSCCENAETARQPARLSNKDGLINCLVRSIDGSSQLPP